MPVPSPIILSAFTGLNSAKAPHLLAPGEAVEATNVDTSAGTLRGFYGPGAAIVARFGGGTPRCVWFMGATGWVEQTAACSMGANDGTTSYRVDAAGSALYAYVGATTNVSVGLPSPSFPSVVAGGSGTTRGYALTFSHGLYGWESNPTPLGDVGFAGARISASLNHGFQIVLPAAPSPYPSANVTVNVYATILGNASGRLYLRASGQTLGTTWTDNDTDNTGIDLNTELGWGVEGFGGDASLDHSPPPSTLGIMANGMHSAVGASGGSGILFAASVDGQKVYWSSVGIPGYFPFANKKSMPEPVLALITGVGETYALSRTGIYAFSGLDDAAINMRRTGSHLGILDGCGATAQMTPYGLVFLSREGLALFDGYRTRVISQGILDPQMINSGALAVGAYFDRYYFLLNTSGSNLNAPGTSSPWLLANGCLVFDMANPEQPGVSYFNDGTAASSALAAHVTPFNAPTVSGLYVTDGDHIYPWRPASGAAFSSRAAWKWKTPALTAGLPTRYKTWNTLTLAGSGAVTVDVFYDPTSPYDNSTPVHSYSLTLPAIVQRLPPTKARACYLRISGAAAAEVTAIQVTCEVDNGL